jgi:phosphoenolpyruvate carboxykinase (GTP)
MTTRLQEWVDDVARMTRPDQIHWCDGSEEEIERLNGEMVDSGVLHALNGDAYPNCFLHRSDPQDVARTEHLTFISSADESQAGPTNNWLSPKDAREKLTPLYDGSMKGRTMYVVPYLMGPAGSPFSKVGVEITDSPYVVANLRIMTRMGNIALEHLADSEDFAPGLHSLGDLSPDRRFITHFMDERLVWSVGSGYGGNALLSKKCFALRIASVLARDEGWMAEHMLILEVELPDGSLKYIGGAFPSACGKTNLAMLISPLEEQGYKVRTIGDDIAWLAPGADGRLWAINPEAGFFGVAPGTGEDTNPNAMRTFNSNSMFTNVAMTDDRLPWWEGISEDTPDGLTDWRGDAWTGKATASHPNARYTCPASQCPSISPRWEDAQGVPIDVFLFGGRRARLAPLVYESTSWEHGVFMASTIGSETTAAQQSGAIGVTRRDPMAMLPFCGYHMADYFHHWLDMGKKLTNPPKVFCVNWFRKDADGGWLWPGFGENLRVLLWALQRAEGEADAVETPIGFLPKPSDLNLDGLSVSSGALDELLAVRADEWRGEADEVGEFYAKFGDRLPASMTEQLAALRGRLG